MTLFCQILSTEDSGQVVAGTLTLKDHRVTMRVKSGYETLMKNVFNSSIPVDGGKRKVTRLEDVVTWFTALPQQYDGSYVRAKITRGR